VPVGRPQFKHQGGRTTLTTVPARTGGRRVLRAGGLAVGLGLSLALGAAPALSITTADADASPQDRDGAQRWSATQGARADADATTGGRMFRADRTPAAPGAAAPSANDEPAWQQQLRDWVTFQMQARDDRSAGQAVMLNEAFVRAVQGDGGVAMVDIPGVATLEVPRMFQLSFDDRTGKLRGFTIADVAGQTSGRIDDALTRTRSASANPGPARGSSTEVLAALNLTSGQQDPATEAQPQPDSLLAKTYRLGMKRPTQVAALIVILGGYLGLSWWVKRRFNRPAEPAAGQRRRRRRRRSTLHRLVH